MNPIFKVSDNDNDMLMTSNTWYYILAVSIPGLMTLGGNHLFDMGLGVTGKFYRMLIRWCYKKS